MKCCPENGWEAICLDLRNKAALDVDATVSLIEAFETILAGKDPDEAGLTELGRNLPGKSPVDLAREITALRGPGRNEISWPQMLELRDSLYRYQSVYGQGS